MSLLCVVSRAAAPIPAMRRTLVSSVLLQKNWEAHTATDLRKEAKKRGLPVSGAKATLITRIQEHEKRTTLEALASAASAPTPAAAPAQRVRYAHVNNAPPTSPESAAPAPGSLSPGIPPAAQPYYPKETLSVNLPDLTAPDAEEPVQIPYGPDFWHSTSSTPTNKPAPKLFQVGGSTAAPSATTVYDVASDPPAPTSSAESSSASGPAPSGLWANIATELGVPTSLARPAHTNGNGHSHGHAHGRALDTDERRGVWVLGGILAGAWLTGGVFDAGSAVKEGTAHVAGEVKAKAEEVKGQAEVKVAEVKGKAKAKAEEVKSKVKS